MKSFIILGEDDHFYSIIEIDDFAIIHFISVVFNFRNADSGGALYASRRPQ